jgi:hypothetical protein
MQSILLIAGDHNDHFSVEIHHAGFFCGLGNKMTYMDNKIDWFDFCNSDT